VLIILQCNLLFEGQGQVLALVGYSRDFSMRRYWGNSNLIVIVLLHYCYF